jgi:membrane protein implicated in regulation of membrane protease activity
MASGASKRFDASGAVDSFFFEAPSLGVLLLVLALIREPRGFMSLSLPGGVQGSVMLFSFNVEFLLPVQLIASSGGALLLLGYFWSVYKFMNKEQEGDKNAQ